MPNTVTMKQYEEILERIRKLEVLVEKQNDAIEDLRNKLQVERDLRMLLQEKMENYEVWKLWFFILHIKYIELDLRKVKTERDLKYLQIRIHVYNTFEYYEVWSKSIRIECFIIKLIKRVTVKVSRLVQSKRVQSSFWLAKS